MKTGDLIHHGPFAELVRDVHLNPPETGSHDYLGCPEIVEDIASSFTGVDLRSRYLDASTSALVKFWSTEAPPDVVGTALWYAYARVRGDSLSRNACWGFSGDGKAIPPADITAVELNPAGYSTA